VSYLYDPSSRYNVILTVEDKATLIDKQEWLPYIKLPELIEVSGQQGISFWRVGPSGASQMRVYLDKDRIIQTDEMLVQEFLNGESQSGM
jgi:hypothetical protein